MLSIPCFPHCPLAASPSSAPFSPLPTLAGWGWVVRCSLEGSAAQTWEANLVWPIRKMDPMIPSIAAWLQSPLRQSTGDKNI